MEVKKGKFIVVVGPSGVGKDTLIDMFLKEFNNAERGVSATSRAKRDYEVDGVDYIFLSDNEFKDKIERGDFLEYAYSHKGLLYGVLKEVLVNSLNKGKIVINDINVDGLLSVKEKFNRDDYVSVFIKLADGIDVRDRILLRGELPEEKILDRIDSYKREIGFASECDLIIDSIEGDIPKTYENFKKAIFDFIKNNK